MDGFERRRQIKKNSILQTALELFLRNGVQKVSIPEIANKAKVSQVTIYNYFGSKDSLIHDVIIYYVDQIWVEYEDLFSKDIPFPEKIKHIIFDKKEIATHIHQDFYEALLKDYSSGKSYIEKLYSEKVLPKFIELFEQGKRQGYVDPTLSNEAIAFYFQMYKEFIQKNESNLLPLTEDLTKMFFYGIMGKPSDH